MKPFARPGMLFVWTLLVSSRLTPAVFTQDVPQGTSFVCPMHPDVRAGVAGRCPRCGMKLVLARALSHDQYVLEIRTEPKAPHAGMPARLFLQVRDVDTGRLVQDFAEVHERIFHLFVVSDDLAEFDHVHPELGKDGTLEVDLTFRRAGRYQLYADFVPADGTPQLLARTVYTAGRIDDPASNRPRIEPDTGPKHADGSLVELQLPPGAGLVAGESQAFRLYFRDEAGGVPLTDLEPYLGAPAHLLVVSGDLVDAMHSHPAVKFSSANGPDVVFEAVFPRPGTYRMWVQFKRHGRVSLAAFTVAAARAPAGP
jgi:hypothetical protein